MPPMTFFKAQLSCNRCNEVSTAWIGNKLGEVGATYEVGDCPGDDIQLIDFEDTCLAVRAPRSDEAISVFLPWTCDRCRLGNWSVVVLESGCVRSIEGAELTPTVLNRVNFVEASIGDDFEQIVGEPMWTETGVREDWRESLQSALDAGKRW